MAVNRDRTLKKFGKVVAEMRREEGMSQEELAERSGLHRTYVGGIERGERNPTLTTIVVLAKGLLTDPAELLRRGFGES